MALGKERLNLGKLKVLPIEQDLLEIQLKSFEEFLQNDKLPEERDPDKGLHMLFTEFFPIVYEDENYRYSLEYDNYTISHPKYTPGECRAQGLTYEGGLRIKFKLFIYDRDELSGEKRLLNIKESNVFMGDIPLMTEGGSFIVSGTERTVVSQLQRISGVNFGFTQPKDNPYEKTYFCELVPVQGPWLKFFYQGTKLRAEMNKKTRNGTWFLRAFGFETDREIIALYNKIDIVEIKERNREKIVGRLAVEHVFDDANEVYIMAGDRISEELFDKLLAESLHRANDIALAAEQEIDKIDLIDNVREDNKAEIYSQADALLRLYGTIPSHYKKAISQIKKEYKKLKEDMQAQLNLDLTVAKTDEEKQKYIDAFRKKLKPLYRLARAKIEHYIKDDYNIALRNAENFFRNSFFNPRRYNLGKIGRYKINQKLGLDTPIDAYLLSKNDIEEVLRYLINLKYGHGEVDDIDSLANKRVRTVATLLLAEIGEGLENMERFVKEKMQNADPLMIQPQGLVNQNAIKSVINKFFGTDQLSQFLDQTNPLAEITNKRRLSALGKHGLKRETAQMEVRDLHHTHYGRLCPIETPEGQNIGLITSLATFGRLNDYGFIETPFRKVKNGKVTDEVVYLTALEEENETIAQANEPLDEKGRFINELVSSRRKDEFPLLPPDEITYIDLTPLQTVGVSASLIPFLEHDDANRALMGSNMQRQSVPLLFPEQAYVGTGMERRVARLSRSSVNARRSGVVEYVDSAKIIIRADKRDAAPTQMSFDEIFTEDVDVYFMKKYQMSNQNTSINQIPVVREGDRVNKGDIIADGPSMRDGELALGRNLMVAFMPWEGYNYEDAIVISERLLKQDLLTTVIVEEFDVDTRDTRLGSEEITRDIPAISEEKLKNLDEKGIIRLGAYVQPGDILVGKITPTGEKKPTPEELLLQAIFGEEKSKDVKNVSLKAPHGCYGTVIDVKLFSRKREGALTKQKQSEIKRLKAELEQKKAALVKKYDEALEKYLKGQMPDVDIVDINTGEIFFEKGKKIGKKDLSLIQPHILEIILNSVGNLKKSAELKRILYSFETTVEDIESSYKMRIARIRKGDDLPSGVNKLVKITVAKRRKVSIGDKLAGRHGNKGVISTILKEADMPFLEDGTPVDIVLNPLGVPSRMNVGQILETYLGFAVHELKKQGKLDVNVTTPVFDGASEDKIKELMREAGLDDYARTRLYDGRTGEAFEQRVTVGFMYIMKLIHMIDDKMHARSTGPYSLITQQPLGGKAMFGGQRLGEMEVWAFEAYGAAYCLQEMLTLKSDDVVGRTKMYESIVKGDLPPSPGVPESFNVVMNELRGLGIDIILHYIEDKKKAAEEELQNREITAQDIFKEDFLQKVEGSIDENELLKELEETINIDKEAEELKEELKEENEDDEEDEIETEEDIVTDDFDDKEE